MTMPITARRGRLMFPTHFRRLYLPTFVAAMLALPSVASAQEIKPNVMLLFDTSGSMQDVPCSTQAPLFGDNSNECLDSDMPCANGQRCYLVWNQRRNRWDTRCDDGCDFTGCNNGLPDDTRIFKVKKGASSVISAFGEVTFGLSRFHQVPATFRCDTSSSGGWDGAPQGCSNDSMNTGWNRADVLVGFTVNNQGELLSWMNNCDDYPTSGACPVGVEPGTNGHPDTPTNCPNNSLCPTCGTGCDKELRPSGYTPLAGSLNSLRNNFFPSALTADTKAVCRPYKVIMLTDGQDNCAGDPETEARALFQGTGLPGSKSVQVHVIGFASSSIKGDLDLIAAAGGTGSAVIVDDEVSLSLAMANIISEAILRETCNNRDDDCDNQCDESWPEVGVTAANGCTPRAAQTCSAGVGVCLRTGVYRCKADGSGSECSVTAGSPTSPVEICGNGLDDDCNGLVDDGCGSCTAQPDVCDGRDNDCDKQIDEDFVPGDCGSSIGECKLGRTVCVNGQVSCSGNTGPGTEICDGKDNNCDTIIDNFAEACYASPGGTPYASTTNPPSGCPAGQACLGICQRGSRICTAGKWGACAGAVGPVAETCNGLDDDCDGVIDNGVSRTCTDYSTCKTFTTCAAACPPAPTEVCDGKDNDCDGKVDNIPQLPCGTDVGECTKGHTACDAKGVQICTGGKGPSPELCDGKDNNCNGAIDDAPTDPTLNSTCGVTKGECTQGTWQCSGGKLQCLGGSTAGPEVCDGKDNDCDGIIDNNIAPSSCGSNIGECTFGTTVCRNGKQECDGGKGPSAETCDGKDNDCNGLVDDSPVDSGQACGSSSGDCVPGLSVCQNGAIVCVGAKGGSPEVCDGRDNDCNGKIDDGLPGIGVQCGTTDVGECSYGTMQCREVAGLGWTMSCEGAVNPVPETCNGKDDDCNGQIDETYPEKGLSCGTDTFTCKSGVYACTDGALICEGSSTGIAETCNGVDDDCNGIIDDGVEKEEGASCGTSNVGECKLGLTKCVTGSIQCEGEVKPTPEICDGKDNDCDGEPDNNAECPGASQCVEGACLLPCSGGEFSCPGGSVCKDNFCRPDKCAAANCTKTQRCIAGTCIEKCKDMGCESFQRCEPTTGRCIDNSCVTQGCPGGQKCVGYVCQEDPCPVGKCGADKMCVDGNCVEPCINITCPSGQVCAAGSCVSNPCQGYRCEENFTCEVQADNSAKCVPDPCRVKRCPAGQVCNQGECKGDPCATARCPSYLKCVLTFDGKADCVPDGKSQLPQTNSMLATGGGGFSCSVGSGGGDDATPYASLLMLVALFFVRRRNNHR